MRRGRRGVTEAGQLGPGDRALVDLVWSVCHPDDAGLRVHARQWIVLGQPGPTEDLDGAVRTRLAMFGTATLIPLISLAAARLPTVSIR